MAKHVTRIEIAHALDHCFGSVAKSRDEIVQVARVNGARRAVITTLLELPDELFSRLRDLWGPLADVPVEP